MGWYAFDQGKSVGQYGSENGTILRDDEHSEGARITLERGGLTAPFSITCGIYGWMVHTRFFSAESEADSAFESMRDELTRILASIPLTTDPDVDAKTQAVRQSLSEFVERFP